MWASVWWSARSSGRRSRGSLLVAFVFLLDTFSGPGMASAPPAWAISQKAADVLIAARWRALSGRGLGRTSRR
ncbi:MAG: hypothetical protein IPO93_18000 [Actinobacteria bacterium]|nr:hypothetical protein [Actinomycetota bacterium]